MSSREADAIVKEVAQQQEHLLQLRAKSSSANPAYRWQAIQAMSSIYMAKWLGEIAAHLADQNALLEKLLAEVKHEHSSRKS